MLYIKDLNTSWYCFPDPHMMFGSKERFTWATAIQRLYFFLQWAKSACWVRGEVLNNSLLSFMADIGHFALQFITIQVLFVPVYVAPTATWQSCTQAEKNESSNQHRCTWHRPHRRFMREWGSASAQRLNNQSDLSDYCDWFYLQQVVWELRWTALLMSCELERDSSAA